MQNKFNPSESENKALQIEPNDLESHRLFSTRLIQGDSYFRGCGMKILSIVWAVMAVIAVVFIVVSPARAADIDMKKIWKIESGGNALAYNRNSGARGLYQITPICLKDYNQCHKTKYSNQDLFNAEINAIVANWYIKERIPSLLKYYGHQVTVENILIAYNAGIKYVGKSLPKETQDYIKKFNNK